MVTSSVRLSRTNQNARALKLIIWFFIKKSRAWKDSWYTTAQVTWNLSQMGQREYLGPFLVKLAEMFEDNYNQNDEITGTGP